MPEKLSRAVVASLGTTVKRHEQKERDAAEVAETAAAAAAPQPYASTAAAAPPARPALPRDTPAPGFRATTTPHRHGVRVPPPSLGRHGAAPTAPAAPQQAIRLPGLLAA